MLRVISVAAIQKEIKYAKVKIQGKLNRYIIFDSVLVMSAMSKLVRLRRTVLR